MKAGRIVCSNAAVAISVLIAALPLAGVFGRTIYVDDSAAGANDGSSWLNAYNYLQDALADASSSAEPVEIRVAEGTYRPDENSLHPSGTGHRQATFQLINGVGLKGGYAGAGAPDPNARDIGLYKTILSGDLAADDADVNEARELLDDPCRAENSFRVVTAGGTDANAVIDGFTITGASDGGMLNDSGSPTLINCTFTRNSTGGRAAGMCNDNSSPTISNCAFTENSALMCAGGMYNSNSSNPTLRDCTFNDNFGGHFGGGMVNEGSDPTLTDCIFSGNSAMYGGGGGITNSTSNPVLIGCTFISNSLSGGNGGGINNAHSNPILAYCTFNGNSAMDGGGINNSNSSPTLTRCTFTANTAERGGAIYNGAYDGNSSPTLTNCDFNCNSAVNYGGAIFSQNESSITLANCTFADNVAENGNALACVSYGQAGPGNINTVNSILRDGADGIWNNNGSTISITHSNVQGSWPGQGNIDLDPCFCHPAAGDYHLLSGSPCIDAGDPMSPIGHEPFPNGGIVNMGAYGGTAEASKSYFGEPPCETIVAGDINGDCIVDFKDFRLLALHWLAEN